MTTVVVRSKNIDDCGPLGAIQRAIDWPEDAVSASRLSPRDPWTFTTRRDILARKNERRLHNLYYKREYGVIERRNMYVWVFWCPGLGIAFRGWWLYLVGLNFMTGKYFERDLRHVNRIMELFPLVQGTLFAPPDLEEWKKRFVATYRRGTWCGKPQGKSPVIVTLRNGHLDEIVSRAAWPVKG